MTSSDPTAPDLDSLELEASEKVTLVQADHADGPAIAKKNDLQAGRGAAENKGGFWAVFLSTFLTIFLAELGDKTQVTTLLMSAESQAPVTVFLGAGSALVATSLIGVLLGQWIAKRVSEETLDICAGILLLLITIGLVADIVGQG